MIALRPAITFEESPDSKSTVPGNARAGQPDGKRHREQTASHASGVMVKRWGKSPPRVWQQSGTASPTGSNAK